MGSWVQRLWYGRSSLAWLLWPLSWIFVAVAALRRSLFGIGVLRVVWVGQPVVVVGNITVGGTGKTPFVAWLANALGERGMTPGIITRGYGGGSHTWPRDVQEDSDAGQVGDEAVLLAKLTRAIVVAGPDRVSAARRAIERGATVVISDDGLQHYRLARDFEIAVIDAERGFGNGLRLPAGPLRESTRRLQNVDALVVHRRGDAPKRHFGHAREVEMQGGVAQAYSLQTGERRDLGEFAGQPVHAIAAIGNPQAFFAALRARGLQLDARALPDHAPITASDLRFDDTAPVLMTEKDAVKCRAHADARCFAVPLETRIDGGELLTAIVQRLRKN